MRNDVIEKGLVGTATVPERIEAFLESGLSRQVLADSMNVSVSSIGRWLTGTRPKNPSFYAIDDIRCVMDILIEAGLRPDNAAMLLQKPSSEPPHEKLIGLTCRDPEHTIEAITRLVDKQSLLPGTQLSIPPPNPSNVTPLFPSKGNS